MLIPSTIYSVDLATEKKIAETEDFMYFAEDERDYTELIELLEYKNEKFKKIFNKILSEKISVYIFSDQLSFSKKVFGSDEPVQNATGLADHVSGRFFITSCYDDCKPKERLMKTPVHELVHIYFPSNYIWIREGIACYYSDMLEKIPAEEIPKHLYDLKFYTDSPEETEKAYNCSSWMIKYIIEECLHNDLKAFRKYEQNFEDYNRIGFVDEADFFRGFTEYLESSGALK